MSARGSPSVAATITATRPTEEVLETARGSALMIAPVMGPEGSCRGGERRQRPRPGIALDGLQNAPLLVRQPAPHRQRQVVFHWGGPTRSLQVLVMTHFLSTGVGQQEGEAKLWTLAL
ncbi:hypothetical protein GCM10007887_27540 [Methylobacterium haplocladii]|uniref:Uncharacterized protein n=1 Tax=Methylobacterium haplocladii TaxID=1176176 RepID=A0A512IQL3_9HYPH|nr:hypothetical protein MHA02_23770 [Methylobacterium haplocladii]GLS60077.1 hypothetical protein GCM10007887_27540 [Methylobacterium haplocladii]